MCKRTLKYPWILKTVNQILTMMRQPRVEKGKTVRQIFSNVSTAVEWWHSSHEGDPWQNSRTLCSSSGWGSFCDGKIGGNWCGRVRLWGGRVGCTG